MPHVRDSAENVPEPGGLGQKKPGQSRMALI